MFNSFHIEELASEVIALAVQSGMTIGTAESCTGGMISAYLTNVPGASNALVGGIVSYSNDVKHDLLNVESETLNTVGAVSYETACQMASGARHVLKADVCVSVTGIAGPGGAVPGKPVGTVWVGRSSINGTSANLSHFDGDRHDVRLQTVEAALLAMKEELQTLG